VVSRFKPPTPAGVVTGGMKAGSATTCGSDTTDSTTCSVPTTAPLTHRFSQHGAEAPWPAPPADRGRVLAGRKHPSAPAKVIHREGGEALGIFFLQLLVPPPHKPLISQDRKPPILTYWAVWLTYWAVYSDLLGGFG
jgi:hypothetical protein